MAAMPYLAGILGLFVLWIVIRVATGTWSIPKLWEGVDKRPSSSKFQFLLWTAAIIFGYLAIYAAPTWEGGKPHFHFDPLLNFDANLFIAMGISGATAVAAKAITASNVANGKTKTTYVAPAAPLAEGAPAAASNIQGGVFQADDGSPDLGKIQMIAWTLIAVGIFLVGVIHNVDPQSVTRTLPDIGRPLMILMGLGHATYVGKKIAE